MVRPDIIRLGLVVPAAILVVWMLAQRAPIPEALWRAPAWWPGWTIPIWRFFPWTLAPVSHSSLSTHFQGCGTPYCGCGVPEGHLLDSNGKKLPFAALNVVKGDGSASQRQNPSGSAIWTVPVARRSEYAFGANCGRWVEVTVKDNCVGGSNDPANGIICRRGSALPRLMLLRSQLKRSNALACGSDRSGTHLNAFVAISHSGVLLRVQMP
jgi:hypothetical protein